MTYVRSVSRTATQHQSVAGYPLDTYTTVDDKDCYTCEDRLN
jgi:hypothetical protein